LRKNCNNKKPKSLPKLFGGDFFVKKSVEKSTKMCKNKSINPIKMCSRG
jgi:hypothetical protein